MTSADLLVERGAERLHRLAGRAAARGDGVGTWLARELEADAAFLRKLKPSLIAARVRANGAAPAEPPPPPAPANPEPPAAASGPEPAAPPPKRKPKPSGGPSPWLFVGAALVVGIVAAKVLDWRGNADPSD
jgi:crotonobetainyl-CoA:carnitine CoA-transferase CaiB-like acyl-CoA transferase